REGDYNLSLGERAALARQSGAPVFVSLHANSGSPERRGAEVWVYGRTNQRTATASDALAAAVCQEIERLGHSAAVRDEDLALLNPATHSPGSSTWLVEADYLSHPDGEARLRDQRYLDALARAVARGVRRSLGQRSTALPRSTTH